VLSNRTIYEIITVGYIPVKHNWKYVLVGGYALFSRLFNFFLCTKIKNTAFLYHKKQPFTYHKKIKIKQQPFVDSGFEGFFSSLFK
jgi:hypothetical protein